MEKNNRCTVCGEPVEPDYNFCPSCGAKIGEAVKRSNISEKKIKQKNPKSEEQIQAKKISTAKIIYVLIFLVAIGGIIIYSSGIFDKPIQNIKTNQMPDDEIHRGINLQSIQQINELEEELKANPEDKSKLLTLAHLLNDSGFKERAIEKYKEYLKSDSKNSDVLVDMAVCYYELGNNEEAIKLMKEALKYQPKHQIAYLNLGIVSLASGNHDEAISWWKKAVEINPDNEIGKRAQELIKSH
ncbi:tetratricopeptide repeat protein [Ignavibacteria bacterium 4148-Me]|uniref:tetratricopeptide repeat protein n=1 Tax=Rosettibacter primus TaxID=3111523 RepID=UPI00336BDD97